MNILWIEDFGGLQAGKNILNQMFGELLSFEAWDNDLFSLKTKPADLNEFCTQQKSLHTIYLCRNYFDYAEFKENHAILNEIDAVIIDVRLDNGEHVDLDKNIPESYTDKSKFHENGGFYIFNDLVHLGIPAEKMCFMTGEKNSIDDFKEKCSSIYIPEVKAFEKKDPEYDDLRIWLKNQESDYIKLRRGIIEGCLYLKGLSEDKLQFNEFVSESEKKINFEDIKNYLEVLESFLPLRIPDNKGNLYKLFIRTLTHEWEAAVPRRLDDKKELFAFSRIIKTTRNWIAHNANAIFDQLTEQDIAFLFICNMRSMFKLNDNQIFDYEKILFSLFEIEKDFKKIIGTSIKDRQLKFGLVYTQFFKDSEIEETDFFRALDEIQKNPVKMQQKKSLFFIKGLYLSFWFLTSSGFSADRDKKSIADEVLLYRFGYFDYSKTKFLFEFSRYIYKRSFN